MPAIPKSRITALANTEFRRLVAQIKVQWVVKDFTGAEQSGKDLSSLAHDREDYLLSVGILKPGDVS